MTSLELTQKWKQKINDLIQKKKDFIPEVDVKAMLKENSFELSVDIDQVLQLSGEKISLSFFVTQMIHYAISNRPPAEGGHTGHPKTFPGLDYYDSRRDKYSSGESAKYAAGFGLWRGDN
jgi:hypothetical protein